LEDPGVGGRCIFKKWDGDMDWIDMAQGRKMWPSLIKGVMNIRAPKMRGIS
jgi:hypothetical protein